MENVQNVRSVKQAQMETLILTFFKFNLNQKTIHSLPFYAPYTSL